MNGEGVLRMSDGTKFKGTFKNGMRNGKGIEEKDGVRFEGSYVNDIKDGPFVEKDSNGSIIRKGYYKHGIVEVAH